jgi:uncharacterized membrane protein YqhA
MQNRNRKKLSNTIEKIFEFWLWNFRFLTIFPVIFGLLSTVNFFIMGSLDIISGIKQNINISDPESYEAVKSVAYIIGGVDYYLIGVVLLIFSFGIYELFISKIDPRLDHKDSNVLEVTSLDHLKYKILQVIVVALIVTLFKKMLVLEIKTMLDLLYLAVSILIVAFSSYLMHTQSDHNHLDQNKH